MHVFIPLPNSLRFPSLFPLPCSSRNDSPPSSHRRTGEKPDLPRTARGHPGCAPGWGWVHRRRPTLPCPCCELPRNTHSPCTRLRAVTPCCLQKTPLVLLSPPRAFRPYLSGLTLTLGYPPQLHHVRPRAPEASVPLQHVRHGREAGRVVRGRGAGGADGRGEHLVMMWDGGAAERRGRNLLC